MGIEGEEHREEDKRGQESRRIVEMNQEMNQDYREVATYRVDTSTTERDCLSTTPYS